MKRQLGVDLTQQGLEAVADLPMPRKKGDPPPGRKSVDVRGLVDLILLAPSPHRSVRHLEARRPGHANPKGFRGIFGGAALSSL